jgi:cytochrome c
MITEHKKYLDYMVENTAEFLWPAISSYLRQEFPLLSRAEALDIVQEYCRDNPNTTEEQDD